MSRFLFSGFDGGQAFELTAIQVAGCCSTPLAPPIFQQSVFPSSLFPQASALAATW